MRRIVFALTSTVTAVVLLFGYRTSTPHPAATAASAVAASGTTSTGSGGSTTPSAPASSRTVTGTAAQTRWGPVQVQLTLSGSTITAVDLVQVPSSNDRDVEINDDAVPLLVQETLKAQSAQIDSVSGATVTSDGYVTSLQSALDQAGL